MPQTNDTSLQERNIDVYLDVCHNEQGMTHVLNELGQKHPQRQLKMIFGASSGKKVGSLMGAMEPHSAKIESISCV